MERRGSGFKKICEDYAFAESYTEEKKPRFISDNDNFTLILPNLNYKIGKRISGTRNGTQGGTRNGTQTDRTKMIEMIIDLISTNNKISRAEISEQLNVSVRTLQRIINDCDRINFVGKGKNGHWIIS